MEAFNLFEDEHIQAAVENIPVAGGVEDQIAWQLLHLNQKLEEMDRRDLNHAWLQIDGVVNHFGIELQNNLGMDGNGMEPEGGEANEVHPVGAVPEEAEGALIPAVVPEEGVRVLQPDDVERMIDFLSYDSDSGCEDDSVDGTCEMVRGLAKFVNLNQIRGGNVVYCMNVSYWVVDFSSVEERKVCFNCFVAYQNRVVIGSYRHFNFHFKCNVESTDHRQQCHLCNAPLYQILMSDVCVTCIHDFEWDKGIESVNERRE